MILQVCHIIQMAKNFGYPHANLPPWAVNVGADQLDDVARLDAECRTNGGARDAIVVPDDQHLWQTCDMENEL